MYLLYDSDCGPCTRFMRVAKVLDLHGELIPVSIHAKQAQRLVRGNLSPNRLKSSFHIVEITNSGLQDLALVPGWQATQRQANERLDGRRIVSHRVVS